MKNIIVCDLDGTLADCEHRVHHVRNTPKNWDAFFAGVRDDKVNAAIHHLLVTYQGAKFYSPFSIIFCSGRPERCRADTEDWLREVCHITDYTLLMRKDGDFRADHIVKQEILDNSIPKEHVLFVLDDRQQVVDMWRRNGLVCFQVAEGNF